jgi:hypothetical protein
VFNLGPYRFKGPPPLIYSALGYLFCFHFLLLFAAHSTIREQGSQVKTASHPYRLGLRGGEEVYTSVPRGLYLDYGFFALIGLLASMVFVMWLYRDQVVRGPGKPKDDI